MNESSRGAKRVLYSAIAMHSDVYEFNRPPKNLATAVTFTGGCRGATGGVV